MTGLPPERAGREAPPALRNNREGIAGAIASGAWACDPPGREERLGGVRVLRFAPAAAPRATLIHFHGGGFRQGCPEMIGPYAAALIARCGVEVVCPAYRLAPEYPFPAGLLDGRAVLKALTRDRQGVRLILSGDSAGGNLAAALTAMLVVEGPAVAGLVLLSPWLDLSLASGCYEANAGTDRLFSRVAATEAAEQYLQGLPAQDLAASPLLGDMRGFPPTCVSVGAEEVLIDDSLRFRDTMVTAGAAISLTLIPAMEHVAAVRSLQAVGAAETVRDVATFINGLLTD